jgi:superfamily II DNA or RNA helicase
MCNFTQYILGLSATPYRRDGLNKLIYVALGNVAAEISSFDLQQAGCRIKPEIVVRETGFDFDYQDDSDYQPMISELVENLERNELIVSDVINESQDNPRFIKRKALKQKVKRPRLTRFTAYFAKFC